MTTQSHALKDSRHRYARLALAACIYYAGTEQVWSADMPATVQETSLPSINSVSEIVNPIPADNPIGAILLSKRHPLLLRADFSRVSELVSQIYLNTQFQPIWFTANRSEKNLNDLLSILNNASNDALNPANYDVDRLKQLISGPNPDNSAVAGYDVALTVSLVRYLHDLRQGQVDPRDVEYPVHIAPKPALDLAGLLKQHLAAQTLTEVVGQFEPKTKQYQQLKQILTRLQQLGNQTGASGIQARQNATSRR